MTPMVSEALPPLPPRDAFLADGASEPLNDLPIVKLGPPLKSNLKWPRNRTCTLQDAVNTKSENDKDNATAADCPEKRSIKWLDNHGKQLIQVKEFEPSDSEDSDNEHEDLFASCTCTIQ